MAKLAFGNVSSSMSFSACVHVYNCHHSEDIDSSITPKSSHLLDFMVTPAPTQPPTTTVLIHIMMVLSFESITCAEPCSM